MLSDAVNEGQVMLRTSDEPATFRFKAALVLLLLPALLLLLLRLELLLPPPLVLLLPPGKMVWMDWMWLNSAM